MPSMNMNKYSCNGKLSREGVPLFFGWTVFVFGVPSHGVSWLAQTLDQNRTNM